MGDIGYLCDSIEEAKSLIFDIIKEERQERYEAQRSQIYRNRQLFGFQRFQEKLYKIIERFKAL